MTTERRDLLTPPIRESKEMTYRSLLELRALGGTFTIEGESPTSSKREYFDIQGSYSSVTGKESDYNIRVTSKQLSDLKGAVGTR